MNPVPPRSVQTRLLALLEKNLSALDQLTAAITGLEQALIRVTAHRAGLLSRAEVCAILGVTPEALYTRMVRGRVARPVQGAGRKALWRLEDIRQGVRRRVAGRETPREG